MLIIKNANIYTMAGSRYDNGFVACSGDKIAAVGPMTECLEAGPDDQVIDAAGMVLMPGLVDAHCHVGMVEDAMGFEGDDVNEMTDPVTPHLRAIDGINPYDRAFEEARQFGVTTVVTGPGSANVLGGQFTAIKTWGRTVDEMIVRDPCAMKIAFGENPKTVYNEKHQAPSTRMATAAILREQLFKAREYLEALEEYEKDKEENDKPEFDMKLEALLPVIKRELVVKAHAHRADDIVTAIRIAREFNLDMTIDHCTEGWLIPDVLKECGVDVIVGPLLTDRSKIELKNQSLKAPGILAESGVRVAIMSDHPCVPVQHLMLCAALSVREGMNPEEALKAITINAARACRIDDRVGSLEVGKDADMVMFTGHPFDYMTKVYMTIINGRVVYTQKKG
ncbi:MAG TPA: amidohydrolase [Thermoclostridium caenicola]|uniref:amidohydrolase n=1 Tax=Thermoclostridium caenicola TaxID=659425 RepID=UPI002B8630E5|nr:amidohydrolase [Thermoclostridium caenicola]HOL83966.1 amidohydrolase [Thermoclostridium caenicola]HPO75546.1 amidohydrolase [Thermoclostridium caenicola]